MRSLLSTFPFAISIFVAIPSVRAQLLADSIADFSGTQGYKNWQYGYYSGSLTPASFKQMTDFHSNGWFRPEDGGTAYWTSLWNTGGHPNGPISSRTLETNFAVRRWTVPANYTGRIRFGGNIWKQNNGGGDGTIGRVFINSQEVLSQPIAFGNTAGIYFAGVECVQPFDTVDLVIDPGANDYFDSTHLDLQITGAFFQGPVSASACTAIWAEFSVVRNFNDPVTWQFESSPGVWKNLNTAFQFLACGGRIKMQNTASGAINIMATGCIGTSGIPIRCIMVSSCGTMYSDVVTLKICGADLNCDGVVDDGDFQIFVTAYDAFICSGPGLPANCPSDLNGDGRVDDADFVRFIGAYNALICP